MSRMRDIQSASRAATNSAHQAELHHLRHIVRELERRMPQALRADSEVRDLAACGCGTTMHVVRLVTRRGFDEAHLKELEFGWDRLRARREAGRAAAIRVLRRAPWRQQPARPWA
jgi:NTE family protein